MVDRSKDWLAQAERDLDHAKSARKEERHELACFAGHQSAEKAVKALHLFLKAGKPGSARIFYASGILDHMPEGTGALAATLI